MTTKDTTTATDAGSVDTPELRELVEEIIEQAGFYERPSLLGLPAWEHFIAHIHAWRDQGTAPASPAAAEVTGEHERATFEAWHGGIYRGAQEEIAFAAWQARAALANREGV